MSGFVANVGIPPPKTATNQKMAEIRRFFGASLPVPGPPPTQMPMQNIALSGLAPALPRFGALLSLMSLAHEKVILRTLFFLKPAPAFLYARARVATLATKRLPGLRCKFWAQPRKSPRRCAR
jgi:hypothetical protein